MQIVLIFFCGVRPSKIGACFPWVCAKWLTWAKFQGEVMPLQLRPSGLGHGVYKDAPRLQRVLR